MDTGPRGEGPLQNARLREPIRYFNIRFGYVLGRGTEIGSKLLHDAKNAAQQPA